MTSRSRNTQQQQKTKTEVDPEVSRMRTQITTLEQYPTKRKLQIKSVDMDEDMRHDSIRLADAAMCKSNVEMEIAMHIKRSMDSKFPPPWHCIVGRKFGSYVTHESGFFIYFYMGHLAILLFKSKD